MLKIILSLFLISALAGTLTVRAQDSSPGEVLYLYKLYITENVEKALAFSNTAKAEVSVGISEQRLAELQSLIANNALASSTQDRLLRAFDKQAAEVEALVITLKAEGKFDAAQRTVEEFQAMLGTYVSTLSTTNSPATMHLQAVLNSMSALSSHIAAEKKKAER